MTLFFADVDVVLLRDPRPYIDAALADGRVGFGDFIRDVRRLARKQFFDKMRAAKIVAKRSPDRGVYRQSF